MRNKSGDTRKYPLTKTGTFPTYSPRTPDKERKFQEDDEQTNLSSTPPKRKISDPTKPNPITTTNLTGTTTSPTSLTRTNPATTNPTTSPTPLTRTNTTTPTIVTTTTPTIVTTTTPTNPTTTRRLIRRAVSTGPRITRLRKPKT